MDDDFDDGNPYAPPPPNAEDEASIPESPEERRKMVEEWDVAMTVFHVLLSALTFMSILLLLLLDKNYRLPLLFAAVFLNTLLVLANLDLAVKIMRYRGRAFVVRLPFTVLLFVPMLNLLVVLFLLREASALMPDKSENEEIADG